MLINLFDENFRGDESSDPELTAKHLSWVRDRAVWNGLTVFTDEWLLDPIVPYVRSPLKVGYILEPRSIKPHLYENVSSVEEHFHFIMTFDRTLLEHNPRKYVFAAFGGSRIHPRRRGIPPKSRDVSMIFSAKSDTPAHRLRHSVARRFAPHVDLFGGGTGTWLEDKAEACVPYRYSIAIENGRQDFYFSEKLIDCFLTGTVPIYYGCPSIGNFFDVRGMLAWESDEELELLLRQATEERYAAMASAIARNYELAQQYTIFLDWVALQILSRIQIPV